MRPIGSNFGSPPRAPREFDARREGGPAAFELPGGKQPTDPGVDGTTPTSTDPPIDGGPAPQPTRPPPGAPPGLPPTTPTAPPPPFNIPETPRPPLFPVTLPQQPPQPVQAQSVPNKPQHASVHMRHGTLVVDGRGTNDNIKVVKHGDRVLVKSDGKTVGSFPADHVKGVHVRGKRGADDIHVDVDKKTRVRVEGGDGADDIRVRGSAHTSVTGGSGADDIKVVKPT